MSRLPSAAACARASVLAAAAVLLPAAAAAAAAPVVTAISAREAPNLAGATLTISGRGFTGATAVNLSGASTVSYTVVDDGTITAKFSPGSPGFRGVTVTAGGQTSVDTDLDRVRYIIGPDRGQQGRVQVTCTLGGAAGARFEGQLTTELSPANRTLLAGTPSDLGAFTANLYVPDSSAVTANPLGQPVGLATVTSIDADVTGATASAIDLAATAAGHADFPVATTGSSNPMEFGIGAAPTSQLTATGKADPVGLKLRGYHARVTLNKGDAPLSTSLDCLPSGASRDIASFQVTQPAPLITALSVTSGPTTGGTAVRITGEHLTNAATVTLDRPGVERPAAATFRVLSDTELEVTTPAHLAGDVGLVVSSPGAVSEPSTFSFVASAPANAFTATRQLTCTVKPDESATTFTLSPGLTVTGSLPSSVLPGEPGGITGVTATLTYSPADVARLRTRGTSLFFAGALGATITGTDRAAVEPMPFTAGALADLSTVPAGSGLTVTESLDDLLFGTTTAFAGGLVTASSPTFTERVSGTSNSFPGARSATSSCTSGPGEFARIPVATGATGLATKLTGTATLKTLTTGSVPLTGSLNGSFAGGAFSGDLALDPTTANLVAIGFLPVKAKLAFASVGETTGTLDGAAFSTSTKVRIKVPLVSIFGLQIVGSPGCQTKSPSLMNLKSASFDPLVGGTLAGTFRISDLTNCGGLTGLVSSLTAGPNNAIALRATAAPR